MEAEATIEQRENLADLNADRMNEMEKPSTIKRPKDTTNKYPASNIALVVILSMFAIISDAIGLIPLIGQFVSIPFAAILRLGRRLSGYPNIVDKQPVPNIAYVLITFLGGTRLGKQMTGKFKK